MSIKIYNAYRTNLSFPELHRFLLEAGVALRALAEPAQLKLLAARMEDYFDAPLLEWDFTQEPPEPAEDFDTAILAQSFSIMEEAKLELKRDTLDHSCQVQVFPLAENDFLLRVLSEQKSAQHYFSEHPALKDFHYQTSTDRPDEVSEAEWDERHTLWAQATGDFRQLVERSALYTLVEYTFPIPTREAITPYLSSRESRAKRLAEARLLRTKLKDEPKFRVNQVLTILREIRGGAYTLEHAVMTERFLPQVQPLWEP